MTDIYQERYEAHQKRKAQVLAKIMRMRHSNRIFDNREVGDQAIHALLKTKELCPSSCDRQGIILKVISDRDPKALLGGLLVGGTGWVHRAPHVILLFADPVAYKAGDEIEFMPYLDAGVVVQQLYLTATAMGLHGAFINPNIRPENKHFFHQRFGQDEIFCGAFAFGHPEVQE